MFGLGRPSGPYNSLYANLVYPRLTGLTVEAENGEGSECGSVIEATVRGIGVEFDIMAWDFRMVYDDGGSNTNFC